MARLIVNPGSPTQWEIPLKPGLNTIGRGFDNDFKIADVSVSTAHCQVIVENGRVLLKDLGSTNGSFVNRAPVQETALQPGQTIHLGRVPMYFDLAEQGSPMALAPAAAAPALVAQAAAPARLAVAAPTARPAVAIAAAPVAVAAAPPPRPTGAIPAVGSGPCKYHPKTAGRYFCPQCQVYYCELCVTTRAALKMCRHCGAQCVPAQVHVARPPSDKGFYGLLPKAFLYPFRGSGLLVLLASTVVFTLLNTMASRSLVGFFIKIVAFGYLFSYMQNIIHATANEEEEMPDLPGFDDVFGGAFRFGVVMIACFAVPIALLVMQFFDVMSQLGNPDGGGADGNLIMTAYIATTILGCLYFPMAFLAVAMKDSALACNPLVVIPAILKVPAAYLLTAILVVGVYGVRQLGDNLSSQAAAVSLTTHDMSTLFVTFGVRSCWSLASFYLLTVSMRVLGLLYLTNKHKLGWFSR